MLPAGLSIAQALDLMYSCGVAVSGSAVHRLWRQITVR
jgi:hypothetical protein